MAAVHILNSGEMVGFKIVPYIGMQVKKALKYVISNYAI